MGGRKFPARPLYRPVTFGSSALKIGGPNGAHISHHSTGAVLHFTSNSQFTGTYSTAFHTGTTKHVIKSKPEVSRFTHRGKLRAVFEAAGRENFKRLRALTQGTDRWATVQPGRMSPALCCLRLRKRKHQRGRGEKITTTGLSLVNSLRDLLSQNTEHSPWSSATP